MDTSIRSMDDDKKQPIFQEINADDDDQMPMSVESLCMSCEEKVGDKT